MFVRKMLNILVKDVILKIAACRKELKGGFAGVGGIDLGFEESGGFKTVYANEFDSYPSKTFELNFPDVKVDVRDIREVKSDEIPEFDVMLAGFPCQAFSIAGYRKGFDDEKGRGEFF